MRFILAFFCLLFVQINLLADVPEKWSSDSYQIVSDRYDDSVDKGYFVLRGFVVESNSQEPLVGSNIMNKDKSVVTTTDLDGLFNVKFPIKDTTIFCITVGYNEVVLQGPFENRHVIEVKIFVESGAMVFKPVIYAYNATDEFSLSLKPNGYLTFTYPESEQGNWTMKTNSDGTLTNTVDQKSYPYIFWEGEIDASVFEIENKKVEGYLIKTDTCVSFLENTLLAYGLNEKEATDFITFWGPKMIEKPYALVRFLTKADYEEKVAHLTINPEPETLIRLYMYFVPMETDQTNLELSAPIIEPITRHGFTVVEWGGSVLNTKILN